MRRARVRSMGALGAGGARAVLGVALMVGALSAGAFLPQTPAGATGTTTLYVNASLGTKMTGCSGRGATACQTVLEGVDAAELLTGTVVVTVAAGTYTGGVTVTASGLVSLTVRGAGASSTTVSGRSTEEDFDVYGGTVVLSDLGIDDGTASEGGGVFISTGTTTLSDDTFSGDTATFGGGVIDYGTADVIDDTFTTDHAGSSGGGFTNAYANATLTDDTFSNDTATDYGGGVANWGKGVVTDDTFSGDTATYGGGISNIAVTTEHATATLTDDTFSGDTATFGGTVWNSTTTTATFQGTTTVDGSILDGSCANRTGTLSGTYDVTTTSSCNFGTTDETVSTAALGLAATLAANTSAGPDTLAIGPSSAAFELVPPSACTVNTDERGDPRPGVPGENCDAGAYEYQFVSSTTCIVDTVACDSATSRPGRSTTVTSDEATVTISGRGTVDVGTYRRDPAGALHLSTGKFVGISLSPSNRVGSLVLKDCNIAGGTAIDWWNGHAWAPVVGEKGEKRTSTCITDVLDATTSPSLASIVDLSWSTRFGAVVFGVTKS